MIGIDWTLSLVAIIAFIIIGLGLSFMILFVRSKLVSTAPCIVEINSDPDLKKELSAGQTLLAGLASEGIAVPSPCGGKATCKQCRVQVIEGGGDVLETDRATFTPKELKAGWRLSCQCKIREDMAIKLPEAYLTLREFEGKVVSNHNVATFIKELIVEVDPSVCPDYQPGDYLQFHVPSFSTNTSDWKSTMEETYFPDWENFSLFDQQITFDIDKDEVIRAYSMASYPLEKNFLKFNVRIASPPFEKGKMLNVPWGICSSYLFSLQPGDTVKLSGPFGESHMIQDDRDVIFLIGGAGSSFGRSHIMDLFHRQKTKRRIDLWYGARSLKENIYQEDFEALDRAHDNFTYHLVLSEPLEEDYQSGWPKDDPTQTNYLFKAFEIGMLSKMEEPENCLYYVCGPPLHNASVMKLLDDYGVERESIILDDFGS